MYNLHIYYFIYFCLVLVSQYMTNEILLYSILMDLVSNCLKSPIGSITFLKDFAVVIA